MIQLEIVHNLLVYLQNIVNINILKVMNVRLNVITSYKIIQNNVKDKMLVIRQWYLQLLMVIEFVVNNVNLINIYHISQMINLMVLANVFHNVQMNSQILQDNISIMIRQIVIQMQFVQVNVQQVYIINKVTIRYVQRIVTMLLHKRIQCINVNKTVNKDKFIVL